MITKRASGSSEPINTDHDKSMRKLYPVLEEMWNLRNEADDLSEYLYTKWSSSITRFFPKTDKKRKLFSQACSRRDRRDKTYRATLKLMWIPIKPTPPPTVVVREGALPPK